MAELMFAEPSVETVALAGSVDRARRLGWGTLALAFEDRSNQVFVAEDDQIEGFAHRLRRPGCAVDASTHADGGAGGGPHRRDERGLASKGGGRG